MTITPPGIIRTVSCPIPSFSAKDPASTEYFYFDFTSDLQAGETITAKSVGIAVVLGSDSSASSLVSGSAAIDSTNANVVKQLITGGVASVVYQLVCTVTTSLSHQFTRAGNFQVQVQ